MIVRKAGLRSCRIVEQLQIDSYGFVIWSKYEIIKRMLRVLLSICYLMNVMNMSSALLPLFTDERTLILRTLG